MTHTAHASALQSAAPVFAVDDVGSTMRWYQEVLGFQVFPFPKNPPHVFCVLSRDTVEIMLQLLPGYEKPNLYNQRAGGVWDVYMRMRGVDSLYEELKQRGDIEFVESIAQQPYGDTEFVIRDPNGYVLVFSELKP